MLVWTGELNTGGRRSGGCKLAFLSPGSHECKASRASRHRGSFLFVNEKSHCKPWAVRTGINNMETHIRKQQIEHYLRIWLKLPVFGNREMGRGTRCSCFLQEGSKSLELIRHRGLCAQSLLFPTPNSLFSFLPLPVHSSQGEPYEANPNGLQQGGAGRKETVCVPAPLTPDHRTQTAPS